MVHMRVAVLALSVLVSLPLSHSITYQSLGIGCYQSSRVMFLLDGSDSISPSKFTKVRQYVTREIGRLDSEFRAGTSSVVSVMVYSNDAKYTSFVSSSQFVWDEQLLAQPRRSTNTAAALGQAVRLMAGHTSRDEVRVLVVVTDGDSLSPLDTSHQAQLARDQGMVVVALGVGARINEAEMRKIASPKLFFPIGPFDNLGSFMILWRTEPCYVTLPPVLRACEQPPKVAGPCRGYSPSYSFNPATRACEPFIYSGCMGNDNRFNSIDECQQACYDIDPCEQVFAVNGSCYAYIPSYSYNRLTGRCERFVYGGCGGNDNRFATLADCRRRCNVPDTPPPSRYCGVEADLVWVIDLSDSVDPYSLRPIKSYIISQARALGLGGPYTSMGLVTYSDQVQERVRPAVNMPIGGFMAEVNNIQPIRGGTNTAGALSSAYNLLMTTRRAVPKYAVLLTDGMSLDPPTTRAIATQAKRHGVTIVVISLTSMDSEGRDELTTVASPRRLYTIPSFFNISSLPLLSLLPLQRRCDVTGPTTRYTWPTPTTTSYTILPIRSTTPRGIDEFCRGCVIRGGIGYRTHPDTCTKFVRCLLSPWSRTRSFTQYVIQDCPLGLFWDQRRLICDYPRNVRCHLDRCRSNLATTYPDPIDCQIYWRCHNGTTVGHQCCNAGNRFTNGACVPDAQCVTPKCGNANDQRVCTNLRAHPFNRGMFQQRGGDGGWINRYCAPGSAFPAGGCRCSVRVPVVTATPQQQQCRGPDISLSFDRDTSDSSGRNIYVRNDGVVVRRVGGAVGGGAAWFNGSTHLYIPRYSNYEWPPYFRIHFRFLPDVASRQFENQAIVTNGGCKESPSLAISTGRGRLDFLAMTTNPVNNQFRTSQTLTSGWQDVRVDIHRNDISRRYGNPHLHVAGKIAVTQSGLVLGHGTGFANFTGYIDEFKVFLCDSRARG